MKKKLILLLFLLHFCIRGIAYDLYTHLWIAQQVLNDLLVNKHITLNNKQYPLKQEVLAALAAHPSCFRAGTLGPDIVPDPIAGQITAHPGLPNGWKTDDWIQHVLDAATTGEEIAFAYGYACHAAMDVFAHTYVNAYAGDIFLLTDSEAEAERRHFALEKYIGLRLPPFRETDGRIRIEYSGLLKVPARFLTQTFILNDKIETQYLQSGALHLFAMNGVYKAVKAMDELNQTAISTGLNFQIQLLKEQVRLMMELDRLAGMEQQLQLTIEGAKLVVAGLEAESKLVQEQYLLQKKLLEEGVDLLSFLDKTLAEKNRLLSKALEMQSWYEQDIIRLEKDLVKFQTDLSMAPTTIAIEVIERVCEEIEIPVWLNFFWAIQKKEVCNNVTVIKNVVNPAISLLHNNINEATNLLYSYRQSFSNWKNRAAEYVIQIQELQEKMKAEETRKLLLEAIEFDYKIKKTEKEAELAAAQQAVTEAEEMVKDIAHQKGAARERLFVFIDPLLEAIKKVIEEYNLLHQLFVSWQDGIQRGCDAYIQAGEDFSNAVISGKGNGFIYYKNWYECWKPVFTGVPADAGLSICEVKNFYDEVSAALEKLILEDLGVVAWVVAPGQKLKEEALNELQPSLELAATQISDVVLGEPFTDFFELVTGREKITAKKLKQLYSKDLSGKNLLKIPDVLSLLHSEMGLYGQEKYINPEVFPALHNAIVLSKLSLLPVTSLNQLHSDYLGDSKTEYGNELYTEREGQRFCILYRGIGIIDGSAQWMETAWPLYRNSGTDEKWPDDRKYGYARCTDPSYGFRFWEDPGSRKRIFPVLFKGPLYPALSDFASSNAANNTFLPCKYNPFPVTQTEFCEVLSEDNLCNESGWVNSIVEKTKVTVSTRENR